ncbi:hypothetical protein RHMOL_Rhmol01G0246300 [Rhododendron molle]|uniref:Uncharacterized protein n=1 Tax=Rhododendron molle TaxID=49168 RepID=A0ACC0Q5J1_RHOML|nr:hypothetical protein RHMOL_Rhmol01G0246300 [Rhododendron molle]
MKKKKKQRTAQPPPTYLASADIKYLIRKNSSFFDNLIQLIPAKFYLLTEDDSKLYFPGLNKSAKLAVKQQTRDKIKKSRPRPPRPRKKPPHLHPRLAQTNPPTSARSHRGRTRRC